MRAAGESLPSTPQVRPFGADRDGMTTTAGPIRLAVAFAVVVLGLGMLFATTSPADAKPKKVKSAVTAITLASSATAPVEAGDEVTLTATFTARGKARSGKAVVRWVDDEGVAQTAKVKLRKGNASLVVDPWVTTTYAWTMPKDGKAKAATASITVAVLEEPDLTEDDVTEDDVTGDDTGDTGDTGDDAVA